MWDLEDLIKCARENQAHLNGRWVPARPLNFLYRNFRTRLREAWAVLTGDADCFRWPEGQ